MTDKDRFAGKIKCGHCGNIAPMRIAETLSQVETHFDEKAAITWDAGPVYELLICPACNEVMLRKYFYHEFFDGEDDGEMKVLYPSQDMEVPLGLPADIQRELEAAQQVRSKSANAYGVLLGRLLELVCDDRGAKKGSLDARLQELSSKDEIPQKIVDIADKLHQLRHVGAHAWVGELSPAEVPILDSLCRAILEYVYSAPHLVAQAERRLGELRAQQRAKKPTRKYTSPQAGKTARKRKSEPARKSRRQTPPKPSE